MGKHLLSSVQRNRIVKAALVWIHGGRCMDCGGDFSPAVFHFHHRDPAEKLFNVGQAFYGRWVTFIESLKCDLLCANCHIMRHQRV